MDGINDYQIDEMREKLIVRGGRTANYWEAEVIVREFKKMFPDEFDQMFPKARDSSKILRR